MTKTEYTVKIEVPVNDIDMHMVTAIEQGWSWFFWTNLKSTKEGYSAADLTLRDDEYAAESAEDQVRISAALKMPVVKWVRHEGTHVPVVRFTSSDFARGLGLWLERVGTKQTLSQVQYEGNGEWDIDAPGADCVVQMAVFGDIIFG